MEMMKLDQIKVKSSYLRTNTDNETLKKSIETVGLIQPLLINGNNELIAGGRRYSALKSLGIEEAAVVKVHKSGLEQELMSIDENLVRLDLNKVEFEKCLARGKEIYEELNPLATKYEEEDLANNKEDNEIKRELPNNKRSFIDLTAEKTGLSKKVIKSAIDRDVNSSPKVKEARSQGELNASQTNELIKLGSEEQDRIIDVVKNRSAKEIKDMVKYIKTNGVEEAVEKTVNAPQLPTEYKSLKTLMKRMNKMAAKVLLEEFVYTDEDKEKFLKEMTTLRNNLDQLLTINHQSSKKAEQEEEPVEEEPSEEGLAQSGESALKEAMESLEESTL
ncbi:MAG: ParB/RepB/Spo0J family partition protein [Bacteriovoracaceae bacterium]